MDVSGFKVLVDPLYGHVRLDEFLAALMSQPEMQRLRDVRLSNINSLLLGGGANISRFEHSVGTALLAQRTGRKLNLSERQQKSLTCAALLHDVAITPFGHLMEEAFQLAGRRFDHEMRLQQIFAGEAEVGNIERQIFRGRAAGFRNVLERGQFRRLKIQSDDILELMRGVGPLGQLIKGDIDLDNTDNVARMAYHIGIPFRKALPTDIADSFGMFSNVLYFDHDRKELLTEWLDLRRRLYNVFMTNPVDFSAKSMLIEAIRLGIEGTREHQPIFDDASWSLTDREMLHSLSTFLPSRQLLDRFERGDHYDVLGLYWIRDVGKPNSILKYSGAAALRESIANRLKLATNEVLIYWIRDKRTRPITALPLRRCSAPAQGIPVELGQPSNLVLLGILIGKKQLVTRKLSELCKDSVNDLFPNGSVTDCDSHLHLASAFEWTSSEEHGQRTLF